jgi:hypothetical protein
MKGLTHEPLIWFTRYIRPLRVQLAGHLDCQRKFGILIRFTTSPLEKTKAGGMAAPYLAAGLHQHPLSQITTFLHYSIINSTINDWVHSKVHTMPGNLPLLVYLSFETLPSRETDDICLQTIDIYLKRFGLSELCLDTSLFSE